MKKEEIIYVRILAVIGASALMALILIFGAGSGLFQRIANGINDNTLQLSNADAAIYSLYFYKGLDVLYRILYAVTVFGLILTTAAMFVKRCRYLCGIKLCICCCHRCIYCPLQYF